MFPKSVKVWQVRWSRCFSWLSRPKWPKLKMFIIVSWIISAGLKPSKLSQRGFDKIRFPFFSQSNFVCATAGWRKLLALLVHQDEICHLWCLSARLASSWIDNRLLGHLMLSSKLLFSFNLEVSDHKWDARLSEDNKTYKYVLKNKRFF